MKRVAYVAGDGVTVDLAAAEAERLLELDAELRREYDRWSAMFRGGDGRMIVLDAERLRRVLADDDAPQRSA